MITALGKVACQPQSSTAGGQTALYISRRILYLTRPISYYI